MKRAAGADRRAVLAGWGSLAGFVLMAPGTVRAQLFPAAPRATPLTGRQIDTLAKALGDAETHGFRRDEFVSPQLAELMHSHGLQSAQGQALLKAAILSYARAQRGERVPLSEFPEEWSVRPAPYDPEGEFVAAVAADRLPGWLDSLPPRYEGYQALRKALARYRGFKSWKVVPDGTPLTLGMSDPRVSALRKRLAVEDPSIPDAEGDDDAYDATLSRTIAKVQRRYGFTPTGTLDSATLAAINAPVGERVLQIEANMERWRWLPRQLPDTRIQVNIAAAVLAVYRNGDPVMAMKAVAGRPTDQTPMLSSNISNIVLNPPWHVPESIAKKEIWPKVAKDKHYLSRHAYSVHKGDDGVARLIQKAGSKSALGRFKFDFPNNFGVYLHDTPVQSGFSRTSRLASHGCVRVEEPKALANLLLEGDANWPATRVDEVIASDKTTWVHLDESVPVFILYWTAFVDNTGQVEFRADAYDWDRKLLSLIDASKGRNSPPVNLGA